MAAIGALIGGSALASAGQAYNDYKNRQSAEEAATENWNNYVDILAQREGVGHAIANQYALSNPDWGYNDAGEFVMTGTSSPTMLGQALEDYRGAIGDQFDLTSYGLENALGQFQGAGDAMGQALDLYGMGAQDVAGQYLGAAGQALDPAIGMMRYADQAAQGVSPYDLVGSYDQRMANWQEDPGYQARIQAGEDAIMRRASARGGRMGGATLQALLDYNQQAASQEYGNIAQRNASLLGQQATAADRAALATQGIQAGLGQTGAGAAGQLAGMYGQTGGNLADMLGRMGSQYGGTLADLGQTAGATTLAGYGQLGDIQRSGTGSLYDQILGLQDRQASARQYKFGGGTPMPQAVPTSGSGLGDALSGLGSTMSLLGAYGMMNGGDEFGNDWAAEGNAYYR